jgi:hypothetical protein
MHDRYGIVVIGDISGVGSILWLAWSTMVSLGNDIISLNAIQVNVQTRQIGINDLAFGKPVSSQCYSTAMVNAKALGEECNASRSIEKIGRGHFISARAFH